MLSENGGLSVAGCNGMQLLEAALFRAGVNVLRQPLKVAADIRDCGKQFVGRY
jgi:hypothetical protein